MQIRICRNGIKGTLALKTGTKSKTLNFNDILHDILKISIDGTENTVVIENSEKLEKEALPMCCKNNPLKKNYESLRNYSFALSDPSRSSNSRETCGS